MMKFLRRFQDLGIKGGMARWYDTNTRQHRMGEMKNYAKEATAHIPEGGSVLEVAPGPGYLAIELAKLGTYHINGLDISQDFVEIARRNAQDAGVEVAFQQGNASAMPFPDHTFDFIICTAAFKNFKEPLKALGEMYRVLKQKGICLIIDMNRNVSNREIEVLTKNMGVKGREALFMKLTFKYFLRIGAYTKDGFISLISKTSFKEYEIQEEGVGFHIYLRK